MKLGVGLGYWGFGFTKDDQRAIARLSEELGFDSLWVAEAYGSDAVSVLAWLAAATDRIRLGSAVMQIPGRPATMTAMSAATLDVLSDGRFQLGLGLSGPQVSEGWYGVHYDNPLLRTREYIDVVRLTLERERVRYHGDSIDLPLPTKLAKSLKLTIAPVQQRMPILLAALGPRNVALTGELADGWIPFLFSPAHVDELCAPLRDGAARAGRDPDEIKICPQVAVCVDSDVDAARDTMRWMLALYIGGMGSRDNNFYAKLASRYGFEDDVRRIQDLYLSGRQQEAAAAIPTELIDTTCICGPRERVRDRLLAYHQAGVDTLIVIPNATGAYAADTQVREIAAAGAEFMNVPTRSTLLET